MLVKGLWRMWHGLESGVCQTSTTSEVKTFLYIDRLGEEVDKYLGGMLRWKIANIVGI